MSQSANGRAFPSQYAHDPKSNRGKESHGAKHPPSANPTLPIIDEKRDQQVENEAIEVRQGRGRVAEEAFHHVIDRYRGEDGVDPPAETVYRALQGGESVPSRRGREL